MNFIPIPAGSPWAPRGTRYPRPRAVLYFGCPWLRWIRRLTRRNQDFTMEGVHVVGAWPWRPPSFEMFAESVHCQLSVAKGNRKVVPRTRTGYCEWSVAEGVVASSVRHSDNLLTAWLTGASWLFAPLHHRNTLTYLLTYSQRIIHCIIQNMCAAVIGRIQRPKHLPRDEVLGAGDQPVLCGRGTASVWRHDMW